MHNFLQLMRDQDNGFAVFSEIADDLEQKADFLRGQHGGGFVKNQDFSLAIQHF